MFCFLIKCRDTYKVSVLYEMIINLKKKCAILFFSIERKI